MREIPDGARGAAGGSDATSACSWSVAPAHGAVSATSGPSTGAAAAAAAIDEEDEARLRMDSAHDSKSQDGKASCDGGKGLRIRADTADNQ